jgi:polysaccharide export outer membrane protein
MLRICFAVLFCMLVSTQVFAGDYVIGDGDGLSISVWGVPELSAGATVRPDGKITLPAVGDVMATGLTPVELSRDLTKVLDSYVKKPIVTVSVSGITNNRVYISGGGLPSQVMTLSGRTTLFKLLVSLPGAENTDLRRAYLVRNNKRLDVDFYGLFIDGMFEKDIKVESEDILYLPTNERNKIYVVGAVNAPAYIFYREGLTIFDAILECGGFNKYAKESEVLILRKNEGKDTRIKINIDDLVSDGDLTQNIKLAPGDYVIVQEGMF